MEKSLGIKVLGLVGILLACLLLGNGLLLLLAVAGGMDMNAGMDIFSELSNPSMKPFIKAGIGINHFVMFTLSACLFAYWIRQKDWKQYFQWAAIDSDLLLKFVLLLIFAMPVIGASALALESFDLPDWANSMDEGSIESLMQILQMDGILDLIVNLFIIAFLPALGEELLFRGVIQKELVGKLDNPDVAIFIASVIFSAIHFQVQGFLPKLFIGLILGYAYYWTKSLWYPMVLHFINNGLQTVLLFFAGDKIESMDEEAMVPETLPLLIGVVISCFLCYFIIKNILQHIQKRERPTA